MTKTIFEGVFCCGFINRVHTTPLHSFVQQMSPRHLPGDSHTAAPRGTKGANGGSQCVRPVSYGQRLRHTKVKSDLVELENAQVLSRRLQSVLWGVWCTYAVQALFPPDTLCISCPGIKASSECPTDISIVFRNGVQREDRIGASRRRTY